MVVSPALPEIVESDVQSAIDARTDSLQLLRELGPPDLVHLIKQGPKSTPNKIGTYHFVTGIDASSSASLAAYVNTLTYTPHDKSQKITSGLYCCYNAFSRVDMRVQVTIPGSVESFCIDDRGEKRMATDALWLETYLCAVLRSYSYADGGNGEAIKKIVGVRRFNPITSTEAEHKFFDAAERLFFKGWQLGSEPEVQLPSLVSNYLTSGILKYIHTSGRFTSGINLFEKLRTRDLEISSLLARVYIEADEEVRAISLLHEAIQELPMDHALLDVQAAFCLRKKQPELALQVAQRGVIAAPSEFGTWARLAEVYVTMENWELALLTLNSCPMFTYQDKDVPIIPEPAKVLLPVLPESLLEEINDDSTGDVDSVHPTLRRLHAAGYKGTFLKAYSLLTEVTSAIGWDQLLKIRSQVFVMEEEYRTEKQAAGDSRDLPRSRNPSTAGLRGTPSPRINGNGSTDNEDQLEQGEPKSSVEEEYEGEGGPPLADETGPKGVDSITNGISNMMSTGQSIEKPENTVASEEVKSGSEDPDTTNNQSSQLQNKRLCERWLDNLFMVLYEDLRVFTIWRTELAQYREMKQRYEKTAEEWEILGDLATRLHHPKEAFEAYEACLVARFSPKAMKGVMDERERDGNGRGVLTAIIRLIAWQYRWYSEFSPNLLFTMRKLIEQEGAVKVRSIVQAMNLPQPILDLTHHYAALCAAFRSNGSDG